MWEDLNPFLEDKWNFYISESVMVDVLLYLNPMLKKKIEKVLNTHTESKMQNDDSKWR